LWFFDPLTCTAAGSVVVNIWARAGPDMQVSGANSINSPSWVVAAGPETADDFSQEVVQLDDQPGVCPMGGPLVPAGVGRRFWGEEVLSLRTVLRRPFPTLSLWPMNNVPAGHVFLQFPLPMYPPVARGTSGQAWSSTANTAISNYPSHIFGILAASFFGMGGGMCSKLVNEVGNNNHCFVVAAAETNPSPNPTLATPGWVKQTTAIGGGIQPPFNAMYMRGASGIESLFYSAANALSPVSVEYTTLHSDQRIFVPPVDGAGTSLGGYGVVLTVDINSTTGMPNLVVLSSIAEDFNFFGFVGLPAIAWTSTANRPDATFSKYA